MSTPARHVSCALFKDISSHRIELPLAGQTDYKRQQRGFTKIIQIQTQQCEDPLGCLWHLAASSGSNYGPYMMLY